MVNLLVQDKLAGTFQYIIWRWIQLGWIMSNGQGLNNDINADWIGMAMDEDWVWTGVYVRASKLSIRLNDMEESYQNVEICIHT